MNEPPPRRGPAAWPRWRPLAFAGLAAALILAAQAWRAREWMAAQAAYALPGFDAFVYVAMAEHPRVFTLAPWGHRVLSPAIASLLPGGSGPGFAALTFAALWGSALLLAEWLRRLGHPPWRAALAAVLFCMLPPVRAATSYIVLVEPVGLLLLLALLLALETGAGAGPLALVATLAALNKEVSLLFLPVVFFARREREGVRRALRTAIVTASPAVAAWALVHFVWPAGGGEGTGDVALGAWAGAVGGVLARRPEWVPALMLWGVTPLAVAGALRTAARPFLRRYGWLAAVTLLLPFAASIYTGGAGPAPFFSDDVPRLLLYALPLLLHLALVAVDALAPRLAVTPRGRTRWPAALGWTAGALAVLLAAMPLVALDRYRRLDLSGPRDGPLVLALCRESLLTARRLARGRPVAFDLADYRFDRERSDPRDLMRMRWFLREGWGDKPHYGVDQAEMHDARASLLLPVTAIPASPWNVALSMTAERPVALVVEVNGRAVGRVQATPDDGRQIVSVARDALFRGDNVVTLVRTEDGPARPRLHAFAVRPQGGAGEAGR